MPASDELRVQRSVAGDHAKAILARRQIVVRCGPAAGGGDPMRIEALQLVPKDDALRGPQAARGEFDFARGAGRDQSSTSPVAGTLLPSTSTDSTRTGEWWLVRGRSGLEMDRALDAGKPQFAIRRETSGGLNAAVDLGGFQTVAGSVGEHGDRVDLAVGGGIQIGNGCRGESQGTAHPQAAARRRRSPGRWSCSTGLPGW